MKNDLSKKKIKGFTLIELLVVTAIIGLITPITIVSLWSTKNKAKDARIQSAANQFMKVQEIIFSDKNAYSFGNEDAGLSYLLNDMLSQGASPLIFRKNSDSSGYCLFFKLNNGRFFCVDSKLTYKDYGVDGGSGGGNNQICKNNCEKKNECVCE